MHTPFTLCLGRFYTSVFIFSVGSIYTELLAQYYNVDGADHFSFPAHRDLTLTARLSTLVSGSGNTITRTISTRSIYRYAPIIMFL